MSESEEMVFQRGRATQRGRDEGLIVYIREQ